MTERVSCGKGEGGGGRGRPRGNTLCSEGEGDLLQTTRRVDVSSRRHARYWSGQTAFDCSECHIYSLSDSSYSPHPTTAFTSTRTHPLCRPPISSQFILAMSRKVIAAIRSSRVVSRCRAPSGCVEGAREFLARDISWGVFLLIILAFMFPVTAVPLDRTKITPTASTISHTSTLVDGVAAVEVLEETDWEVKGNGCHRRILKNLIFRTQ